MKPDLPTRFWAKVAVAGPAECWNWQAALTSGYGVFTINKRNKAAHRIAYQLVKGEIPQGLVLDHLCRNRACVNPSHLEPVTHKENCLRGTGSPARNAQKTRCKNGHELNEKNTYIQTTYKFPRRLCRPCKSINQQRYERRRKEKHYQGQTGATPSAVSRAA